MCLHDIIETAAHVKSLNPSVYVKLMFSTNGVKDNLNIVECSEALVPNLFNELHLTNVTNFILAKHFIVELLKMNPGLSRV